MCVIVESFSNDANLSPVYSHRMGLPIFGPEFSDDDDSEAGDEDDNGYFDDLDNISDCNYFGTTIDILDEDIALPLESDEPDGFGRKGSWNGPPKTQGVVPKDLQHAQQDDISVRRWQ